MKLDSISLAYSDIQDDVSGIFNTNHEWNMGRWKDESCLAKKIWLTRSVIKFCNKIHNISCSNDVIFKKESYKTEGEEIEQLVSNLLVTAI